MLSVQPVTPSQELYGPYLYPTTLSESRDTGNGKVDHNVGIFKQAESINYTESSVAVFVNPVPASEEMATERPSNSQ